MEESLSERIGIELPRISIVIATFNAAATLERCLASVANQTYANRQTIVIDGGSTDATVAILQTHAAELSYWESEPDRGIYHAWNKGLAHADGDWIAFLGADDFLWSPGVIEGLAPTLATAYPETRVVYGRNVIVNADGEPLFEVGRAWDSVRGRFRQVMCLPHPGLMHHRSLFQTYGGFDESFRIAGDYELLLRELLHRPARFVTDQRVAGVGHGGVSSTPASYFASLRETRRAQRQHGIVWPGVFWLLSYARVLVRWGLMRVCGPEITKRLLDCGRWLLGKPRLWTRV